MSSRLAGMVGVISHHAIASEGLEGREGVRSRRFACAAHCLALSDVTTDRGFSLPLMCSALATTHCSRFQPRFFAFLV